MGSTGSGSQEKNDDTPTDSSEFQYGKAPSSPLPERVAPKRPARTIEITGTTDTVTIVQPKPPAIVTTTICVNEDDNYHNGHLGEIKSPTVVAIATTVTTTMTTTTCTTVTLTTTTSSASSTAKTISPPYMDRRPSAGCNAIPHAALCQHRYSLQLNGDSGIHKVSSNVKFLSPSKGNTYKIALY